MQQENMLPCFLVVVCCGSSFFVVDTASANSLCLRVDKGGGSDFTFHISPFRLHYPPSPPLGTLPVSGRESRMLKVGFLFTLPLRQPTLSLRHGRRGSLEE